MPQSLLNMVLSGLYFEGGQVENQLLEEASQNDMEEEEEQYEVFRLENEKLVFEYEKGYRPLYLTIKYFKDDQSAEQLYFLRRMFAVLYVQEMIMFLFALFCHKLCTKQIEKELIKEDQQKLIQGYLANSNILYGVIVIYIFVTVLLIGKRHFKWVRMFPVNYILYMWQTIFLCYIIGYIAIRNKQTKWVCSILMITILNTINIQCLYSKFVDVLYSEQKLKEFIHTYLIGLGINITISIICTWWTDGFGPKAYGVLIGLFTGLMIQLDMNMIVNGQWNQLVSKDDYIFGAAKIFFDMLIFWLLLFLLFWALCSEGGADGCKDGIIPHGNCDCCCNQFCCDGLVVRAYRDVVPGDRYNDSYDDSSDYSDRGGLYKSYSDVLEERQRENSLTRSRTFRRPDIENSTISNSYSQQTTMKRSQTIREPSKSSQLEIPSRIRSNSPKSKLNNQNIYNDTVLRDHINDAMKKFATNGKQSIKFEFTMAQIDLQQNSKICFNIVDGNQSIAQSQLFEVSPEQPRVELNWHFEHGLSFRYSNNRFTTSPLGIQVGTVRVNSDGSHNYQTIGHIPLDMNEILNSSNGLFEGERQIIGCADPHAFVQLKIDTKKRQLEQKIQSAMDQQKKELMANYMK